MIVVVLLAVVVACCLVALTLAFDRARVYRDVARGSDRLLREQREHETEILDRMMFLAERPWRGSPAQTELVDKAEQENERRRKELEALYDGFVEDPSPGATYRGQLDGLDEILSDAVFADAPSAEVFDTADLEVT